MRVKRSPSKLGLSGLLALLLVTAACAPGPEATRGAGLNPARKAEAVREAKDLGARGGRVWCVPFARTASGIDIHGNAGTWWDKARGHFVREQTPKAGAVMAFSSTRRMPLGHVAVVSQVLSPREVLVDQANWHRNKVSLGVSVIDVSAHNDWTAVRVAYRPEQFGSVYPVHGFILPKPASE